VVTDPYTQTNTPTHTQTDRGPITIHCAAASAHSVMTYLCPPSPSPPLLLSAIPYPSPPPSGFQRLQYGYRIWGIALKLSQWTEHDRQTVSAAFYSEMKKRSESEETQTLRAGCSKEPKIFAPPQAPFPGAQDDQNLISWRRSLPSPTNPV